MDKRVLKSKIIELKELNLSFQEISDILNRDYSVKMTRQAVCGMYNRAMSDESIKRNKELILTTNDIVNYHLLGYSDSDIREILALRGYDILLKDIKYIIESNKEFVQSLEAEIVLKVVKSIRLGNDTFNIKASISYNGTEITDGRFKDILKLASSFMLKEESIRVLSSIYNATDDKTLIKDIITNESLDIRLKDIEEHISKTGSMSNNVTYSKLGTLKRLEEIV